MSLYLDVVCTGSDLLELACPENYGDPLDHQYQEETRPQQIWQQEKSQRDKSVRDQSVRAIGEILPFVLAKYCIETRPDQHTAESKSSIDHSSRFRAV